MVSDHVALCGLRGTEINRIGTDCGIRNQKLLCYVLQVLIKNNEFIVKDSENGMVLDWSVTPDNINTPDVFLHAPLPFIWSAFGVQSLGGVPSDDLMPLLQTLADAKDRGVLTVELSSNIPARNVDRLVYMGLVRKRTVFPHSRREISVARTSVRTSILHIKKFATLYDPHTDGLAFDSDDAMRESLIECIVRILEDYDMEQMNTSQIAKMLHLNSDSIKALKKNISGNNKCKIRFFDVKSEGDIINMIGINRPGDFQVTEVSDKINYRSLTAPLFEQILPMLAENATEALSTKILSSTFGVMRRDGSKKIDQLIGNYGLRFISGQDGKVHHQIRIISDQKNIVLSGGLTKHRKHSVDSWSIKEAEGTFDHNQVRITNENVHADSGI